MAALKPFALPPAVTSRSAPGRSLKDLFQLSGNRGENTIIMGTLPRSHRWRIVRYITSSGDAGSSVSFEVRRSFLEISGASDGCVEACPVGYNPSTSNSVSACASPSMRISNGLQRYGLDGARADCDGNHLEASLLISQLKQLGRAAQVYNDGDQMPCRLNASDLLRSDAQVNDRKVPLEVVKATAICGVLNRPATGSPS